MEGGQVQEQEEYSIQNLPQEVVISNIFQLLNSQERQIVRRVCSQWKFLIDSFFGQRLVLTNENFTVITNSMSSLSSTTSLKILDLNLTTSHLPFLPRLRDLKVAYPKSTLSLETLIPLFAHSPNLTHLVLTNIVNAYDSCQEEASNTDEIFQKICKNLEFGVVCDNCEFVNSREVKQGFQRSISEISSGYASSSSSDLLNNEDILLEQEIGEKLIEPETDIEQETDFDAAEDSFNWNPERAVFKNLHTLQIIDDWQKKSDSLGNFIHGCCIKKQLLLKFVFDKICLNSNIRRFKLILALNNSVFWLNLGKLFNTTLNLERKHLSFEQFPISCTLARCLMNLEILYCNFMRVQFNFLDRDMSPDNQDQIRQLQVFRGTCNLAENFRPTAIKLLEVQEIHNIWSEILNSQFHIETFEAILCFDDLECLENVFRNCKESIRKVKIVTFFEDLEEESILWRLLTNLPKLNELCLILETPWFMSENENILENCRNLEFLPDCIHTIELTCPIVISKWNDLEKLRSLRQLKLCCCKHERFFWGLVVHTTPFEKINEINISVITKLINKLNSIILLEFKITDSKTNANALYSEYHCNCCRYEHDFVGPSISREFENIRSIPIQNKLITVVYYEPSHLLLQVI